jgi:hypothetical protein
MSAEAEVTGSGMFDFGMTEIEERLRGPSGEEDRAAILEIFEKSRAALQEGLDRGLPSEEFARAKSILTALAAARAIVVAFNSHEV